MITREQLIDEVKRLAQEYPNSRYIPPNTNDYAQGGGAKCYYNKGVVINGPETEGCIFGQATHNLDQEEYEKIANETRDICVLCCNVLNIPDSYYLGRVQDAQDIGYTWSQAIKELRE
jgi:hypothetical protein